MPNTVVESTKLSKAIEKAKKAVDTSDLSKRSAYLLDATLKRIVKEYILGPDEAIIFIIKQSRLHNLIPQLVIFTNKKIVVAQPSLWHLFGIGSMAFKSAKFMQYHRISDISFKRGLFLRSIFIEVIGAGPEKIEGMSQEDAGLAVKFTLEVLENLE